MTRILTLVQEALGKLGLGKSTTERSVTRVTGVFVTSPVSKLWAKKTSRNTSVILTFIFS